MIWFLLIATALCAVFFLFAPLLFGQDTVRARPAMGILTAVSIAAIIGLYSQIGRPDLTGPAAKPIPTDTSGSELVTQLKTRLLQTNSQDPQGWALLARSQMKTGQYDDALSSYETLLKISDNDETIAAEYEQARKFIDRQAAIQASQSMAPEDRQAMINNMVEGLVVRLYENGGSAEEWARLIRARGVLGQDALLAEDIAQMKKQFEGQPDMIDQILGSQ